MQPASPAHQVQELLVFGVPLKDNLSRDKLTQRQGSEMLPLLDVLRVVHDVLLPRLDARSLAALACTCTELRAVMNDCSATIWESAARQVVIVQLPYG